MKLVKEILRLSKKQLLERVFSRIGAVGFAILIDIVEGRDKIHNPLNSFDEDEEVKALIGMISPGEFRVISVDDTDNGTEYTLDKPYKYMYVFGTGYSGATVVFSQEQYTLVDGYEEEDF